MTPNQPVKPLGQAAYGSIPHLLGSRRGPADKGLNPGQHRILTDPTVARPGTVIVTEKLDGSNVAVARIDGQILALNRAGYLASSSPYPQHHRFAAWVETQRDRFASLLNDGERLCGEWLVQAHGTRYSLPHEPFVAFDLMIDHRRLFYDQFLDRCAQHGVVTPRLLHHGGAFAVADALAAIGVSGHGAIDPVEGAVWRYEVGWRVQFLGKWVRPDKRDGCYLPIYNDGKIVWNEWPNCVAPAAPDPVQGD